MQLVGALVLLLLLPDGAKHSPNIAKFVGKARPVE
jgi:hypothetical protein